MDLTPFAGLTTEQQQATQENTRDHVIELLADAHRVQQEAISSCRNHVETNKVGLDMPMHSHGRVHPVP